jgi:hypothetical protein
MDERGGPIHRQISAALCLDSLPTLRRSLCSACGARVGEHPAVVVSRRVPSRTLGVVPVQRARLPSAIPTVAVAAAREYERRKLAAGRMQLHLRLQLQLQQLFSVALLILQQQLLVLRL